MSEAQKFYGQDGRGVLCVRADDYDALAQRCRELEAELSELAERMAKLQVGEDGLLAKVIGERDTLRATLAAASDMLGPALRLGHHAILEQAVTDALKMLESVE